MMHMTIYWSRNVTLLFDSWKTESWTSYAIALVGCFLCSVVYQNMEEQRLRFKSLSSSTTNPSSPSMDDTTRPLLSKPGRGRSRWADPVRVTSAVLFGVNAAIGYLLMLAVMSFNGGVFVAIVLGLSVGYFLFRTGEDDDGAAQMEVENACACS